MWSAWSFWRVKSSSTCIYSIKISVYLLRGIINWSWARFGDIGTVWWSRRGDLGDLFLLIYDQVLRSGFSKLLLSLLLIWSGSCTQVWHSPSSSLSISHLRKAPNFSGFFSFSLKIADLDLKGIDICFLKPTCMTILEYFRSIDIGTVFWICS